MATLRGFDTDSNCSGKAKLIHAAAYDFVIRYYGGSGGRVLTKAEITELHSESIAIGAVYEVSSMATLGHFTQLNGSKDASAAYSFASDANQPGDTAIFFGVDCDPRDPKTSKIQLAGIVEYFQSIRQYFASKPIKYLIGVYGAGATCLEIKENQKIAQFSWLAGSASAWAGTSTYSTWDLYQHNTIYDAAIGLSIDPNDALISFGQF